MQNNTLFQFFHWYYPHENNLWQHIVKEAAHLSELGITAVWLPPAFKANGGTYSVGYDTYDLYDLGEFDQKGTVVTKYGSKGEYLQAIQVLHDNGIQAYADVILNHKSGADETEEVTAFKVDPENRLQRITDSYKIKADTKFTFPGRGDTYSSFKWDFHCFTGVGRDANKQEQGIYKIVNEYGEDWGELLGNEKGNFDYLMGSDIEFRNEVVRKELINWGLWYLETTDLDGFRLDAAKHISPSFFKEWLNGLRDKTDKEVFAVAEYPSELSLMLEFIKVTEGSMSLLDFPLKNNLTNASTQGKDYDLRKILDDTLVSRDPVHSVTFIGNHDMQPLREFESLVESWFKPHAYALILLREQGYPCVFYPDIYGMKYKGTGRDQKEYEIEISPCEKIEGLLTARKNYAYGQQKDYFNDPHLIGWVRQGTDEVPSSGCAVLLSNEKEGQINMEIGKQHAGKLFHDWTQNRKDEVEVDEEGSANFSVNGGSIAVWVPVDKATGHDY